MQETQVWSLIQEDFTCIKATKPAHYNYWACILEPGSQNYWAQELKLLKPERLEIVLRTKRSRCREKPTQQPKPSTAKKKKKKKLEIVK